ncbi:MAG: helix-hairpin-helix domain-containing protein [Planctomycetes bacterium]|nr:helix-hairpin-helix domain-containing protein [Planctomycetota bacterium]
MIEARQKSIQSFAFVISVCVAVCFSLCYVSEFVRSSQSCEIELEGRINPNDVPVVSLVRLPGIGISRAGAIVAYRENFGGKDGGNPAFRSCNDLQKVKGIGPKTVQNISEWLKFE